jgi:hypothetical protein
MKHSQIGKGFSPNTYGQAFSSGSMDISHRPVHISIALAKEECFLPMRLGSRH